MKKYIERRRRGVFGWIFLLLFWGWNGLMGWALFAGLSKNSEAYVRLTSDVERAGAAIGTAIGSSMVLTIWALGAIILGLAVYFSRGRREMIEVEV